MIDLRHGDCLEVLAEMEEASVDCVVTSPPYWALRDYGEGTATMWGGEPNCEHEWVDRQFKQHAGRGDCQSSGKYSEQEPVADILLSDSTCQKCGAWYGQLGLEPHPSLYLEHLWLIFDEVRRVLKPTGTVWVVLGDTFGGSHCGASDYRGNGASISASTSKYKGQGSATAMNGSEWLKPKNLLMIPERFAIGMVERGWWLRNKNIWHKPNAMPSSVKDRFSCTWEAVYFFTKNADYWFDLEAVREVTGREADAESYQPQGEWREDLDRACKGHTKAGPSLTHPSGKNPGDCWTIPTFPFPEAHFATFPPDLIRKPIRAGCPPKVCSECGKPWTRLTETIYSTRTLGDGRRFKSQPVPNDPREYNSKGRAGEAISKTVGWQPTCDCGKGKWIECSECGGTGELTKHPQQVFADVRDDPNYQGASVGPILGCPKCLGSGTESEGLWPDTEPGIVLDPFAGSGTTGLVCIEEDRSYIGIELSAEYCEMQQRRLEKAQRQYQPRLELSND